MDDQEEIGEDRALLPFTGNSSAQLPLSLQDDRQPQDFTVIFDSPDLLQALFAQFSQSMFREEPVDLFGERSVVQLLPPGSVPQEDRAPRFASLSLLSQRPSDVEDEFPVFVESDILPGHVVVSSNVAHTLPRPGFTRVPIVEVDSDDEEEVPPTNVLPSSEQQRLTVGLQDDEEDIVALLSSIHSPAARQELDVTEGFEDVVMLREQIPQSKTVHPSPLPLSRSEQVAPFDEVDYDPDFDVRSLPLRVRKHRSTSLSPAPHFKRDEDDVYSVRSYASTTTAHKKRTGPSLHAVNMSIIERNAERERQRSQKSGKGLAGVVDGIIKKRTDKDLK